MPAAAPARWLAAPAAALVFAAGGWGAGAPPDGFRPAVALTAGWGGVGGARAAGGLRAGGGAAGGGVGGGRRAGPPPPPPVARGARAGAGRLRRDGSGDRGLPRLVDAARPRRRRARRPRPGARRRCL